MEVPSFPGLTLIMFRSTIFSTVQGMVFVGLAIGPWVRCSFRQRLDANRVQDWRIIVSD